MLRAISVVSVSAALLSAGSSAAVAPEAAATRTTASTAITSQCQGYVALTFDDGPTAKTHDLVAALERAGLKATFFNVGAPAQEDTRSVRAQLKVGSVENHSYSHPFLDQLDLQAAANEILGTSQILTSITNQPVTYWRAPFNRVTPEIIAAASSQGLRHVSWTVDTRDWEQGASTASIMGAMAQVRDQDIILLHDGHDTTVNAIAEIAQLLQAKGLCSGKLANAETPVVSSWGDESYVKVVE